ncbi:phosphodiesterase [Ichthyobacterium seriolicida]|uniref:Phosphoesterase n=1 Tax=Ichthyobacterium seriolicida TaxID=242600 RepID=A0A1J1DXW1_9FLAO|nr:phosphodiesterase [Ichthyobacterium seriolicida]
MLSDTHGHIDNTVIKYAKMSDEIWHAGDIGDIKVTDQLKNIKPIRGVFGNIDDHIIRREFPLHNRFFCEKISVWITHIGGYPNRYHSSIRDEINNNPPKLFICGHSHILKVMHDKKLDLLHMNPGAIGKVGFHRVRTMLSFIIDGDDIQKLQVIEIPRDV